MNKIILVGRLVRDPELRYTQSGIAVCNFTLSVYRQFSNQSGERETDFIDVVVWRKAAENVAKYMAKGRQVAVEGSLQIRSYDDSNGIRRRQAEVMAVRVEFLGNATGEQSKQEMYSAPQEARSNDLSTMGEEVFFDDDDLPF